MDLASNEIRTKMFSAADYTDTTQTSPTLRLGCAETVSPSETSLVPLPGGHSYIVATQAQAATWTGGRHVHFSPHDRRNSRTSFCDRSALTEGGGVNSLRSLSPWRVWIPLQITLALCVTPPPVSDGSGLLPRARGPSFQLPLRTRWCSARSSCTGRECKRSC